LSHNRQPFARPFQGQAKAGHSGPGFLLLQKH
jgi:hypothetical protein